MRLGSLALAGGITAGTILAGCDVSDPDPKDFESPVRMAYLNGDQAYMHDFDGDNLVDATTFGTNLYEFRLVAEGYEDEAALRGGVRKSRKMSEDQIQSLSEIFQGAENTGYLVAQDRYDKWAARNKGKAQTD